MTDDISNHEFLALRLRVGGHPRTRNAYFVNIQTDSHVSGELWQHRLYFRKDDGSWEDIFVSAILEARSKHTITIIDPRPSRYHSPPSRLRATGRSHLVAQNQLYTRRSILSRGSRMALSRSSSGRRGVKQLSTSGTLCRMPRRNYRADSNSSR